MRFTTLQKQNKNPISSYTHIPQAPWKYHISISMNIISIIVLILKWLAISVEYTFFLAFRTCDYN